MELSKPPPSGEKNYQCLLDIWSHEIMCTFRDSLRCYNKKNVVPTLEGMQKMLAFIPRKELTCWSSAVQFRCWQMFVSTHLPVPISIHLLIPIDFLQKIREDMVGGPSIVFTRKTVFDEIFIRNSRHICKSIVGLDASQFYPYSMCQTMPAGLYTQLEHDTESNRYKPEQNKSRNVENKVTSYFQRQRPDCLIKSFFTTRTQKKNDCFKAVGLCANCTFLYGSMGGFDFYCPCQEAWPSLIEDDIERGNKKRKLDRTRKQYIKKNL